MDANGQYRTCSVCGAVLPPGAVRCDKCGYSFAQQSYQGSPQNYVQHVVPPASVQPGISQSPAQIPVQTSQPQYVSLPSAQQTAYTTIPADKTLHSPVEDKKSSQFVSDRSKTKTLLLCIFTGIFGGHNFYAKRIGWGLVYLYTWGFWGIGVIVDIIRIATDNFKDDQGKFIVV